MGLKVTVAWPSSESAAFFRFLRKSCKKQLLIVYQFPFILHLALAIRTKPNPSPTWVSYVFRCFQLSTGSFNCTRVFLSDLSRFEFYQSATKKKFASLKHPGKEIIRHSKGHREVFSFAGAFFLPYVIMLIILGIPLVCLEMAVGQRLGRNSVIESWQDLNQSLRGIGIAAAVVSLMTIFYYNYIVAWCLYYFVHSMRRTLLWSTCLAISNGNDTVDPECTKSSPAEYYWYRETLDVADDINKSTGEWRGKQLFDLYSRKGNGFKCTKQ